MAVARTFALRYDKGTLTLNYTNGESCDGGLKKSTLIMLTCDRARTATSLSWNPSEETKPKLEFVRKSSCSTRFDLRTSAACPPADIPSCVFSDAQGNSYDLTKFARGDGSAWSAVSFESDGSTPKYAALCSTLPAVV